MRVRFSKETQRMFLKKVMELVGAPTMKELASRFGIKYSAMKNYFVDRRLLSQEIFLNMSKVTGVKIDFNLVPETWGQIKGGKKSRRA